MTPLSAVLITLNEEAHLGDALQTLRFCDEIVVVDAGSTDRTRDIAAAAGARVIVNTPWPGFAAQRAFATAQATHDWVLALDADERVTPALRAEIEALKATGFDRPGYRIPRVTRYLGAWIRATDWYPDPQLRLFDRRRGAWTGGLVHESFRVDGEPGRLRGELEHHTYRDVADHLQTIDRYTTLWADQAYAEGRRAGLLAPAGAAAWAFVRNYLLRGGWRLGEPGLTVSVLNAHYTYVKLLKLRQRHQAAGR
ncbi:MAG TPA: glycosyltransferase family 2 protein [Vicinamibacteria bacterium]|nr:glycosyltransferase family 2 protein [Vicinamibacteria bacterium]